MPGPDFIDRVWANSDRSIPVLRNLQSLFGTGRLANTGYPSILPVDQGIEHSAGASFAPNPQYFDPREHYRFGASDMAAATLPPRPMACWARLAASMRTRSRSWSRLTITNF